MADPIKPADAATPAPTVEELQAQIAERDAKLAEAEGKLKGYADKDFNFKRMRDMTEAEKSALSARDAELLQRQEKLEEEQKTWKEAQELAHRNDALALLAGDDAELRKKVEFHYGRIADTAVSREQIFNKMKDAARLAGAGASAQPDPFSRAASFSGGMQPPVAAKGLSPEQSELASKLGITADDVKRTEEVLSTRKS